MSAEGASHSLGPNSFGLVEMPAEQRILRAAEELGEDGFGLMPEWLSPFGDVPTLSLGISALALASGVEEGNEERQPLSPEAAKAIERSLERFGFAKTVNPLERLILVAAGTRKPCRPGSALTRLDELILEAQLGPAYLERLGDDVSRLVEAGFDRAAAWRIVEERFAFLPPSYPVPPRLSLIAGRVANYRRFFDRWPLATPEMLMALGFWIESRDFDTVLALMGRFPTRDEFDPALAVCRFQIVGHENTSGDREDPAYWMRIDQQNLVQGLTRAITSRSDFLRLAQEEPVTTDAAVALYRETVTAIPDGMELPRLGDRIVHAGQLVMPPAEVCRRWVETELRPYVLQFLTAPNGVMGRLN
jgi:hypothetical protein